MQRIGPLSMGLLLVPGLHMTAARWSFLSWPGAALLGMLGIVVIGLALTARGTATVASLVSREDVHLSPASVAALRSWRFTLSLWT